MENEMLDQMHKKLVWKITIQFIWILCITAMIICIIYEGIMQVIGAMCGHWEAWLLFCS